MKITNQDGIDVTEAVQILYDMAHGSMDWGSGFYDELEMRAVVQFAVTMGWEVPILANNMPSAIVACEFPEHYTVKDGAYNRILVERIKKA